MSGREATSNSASAPEGASTPQASMLSASLPARSGSVPLSTIFACLPPRARVLILSVFCCAAAPALLSAYGAFAAPEDATVIGFLARRPTLSGLLGFTLACVVLLVLEPPRSWKPRAYTAQLRARFDAIQNAFDSEHRRRVPSRSEEDVARGPFHPP